MAERQSMTTPEVVAKTLIDEHVDFLREAVATVAAQLMETEIAAEIGAARGEVSLERSTHRNGYRPRGWETQVGEIELQIPRKRSGEAYFPSFLEPRKRSEQAIVAVVMEAYVNGVSTRKVDRLVSQLGISGMSKDRVSALCQALDEQVEAFRSRPLEGAHPYLWLDAKVVKVRDRGHVYPKALVIAYSVHESGRREVIGLDIGETETEAFWVAFLRSLRERGLEGVRLCISDEHQGLKAAIARVLACPWQRCTVHFRRDMLRHDRGDVLALWPPDARHPRPGPRPRRRVHVLGAEGCLTRVAPFAAGPAPTFRRWRHWKPWESLAASCHASLGSSSWHVSALPSRSAPLSSCRRARSAPAKSRRCWIELSGPRWPTRTGSAGARKCLSGV